MSENNQQKITYLNTPATGLVPDEIAAPGIDFIRSLEHNASSNTFRWMLEDTFRVRKTVADFIEAPEGNVALIPNFSFGINGMIQSLKGNENILLYDKDYPSLTHPFEVNQFNITWFSAEDDFTWDMNEIETLIKKEKIDLFAFSHAQWRSGALVNIKEIVRVCHQHNVWVVVDTTQTLGAMPISIKNLEVDVLITSNYKWMNAGFGTGVIYLSDAFLEKYPPVLGGVNSYKIEDEEKHRTPCALDFEPGHTNMAGFYILEAAIKDKIKRNTQEIEKHNFELTRHFIEQVSNLPVSLIGPANMNNRSSFLVLKDENGLGKRLEENGIIVTHRYEALRLGFHYYNTLEDVNTLINCIKNNG